MSFLDAFNALYTKVKGDNSTDTPPEPCVTKIDHQLFHLVLLGPSSVMILLLAFTVSRKHKFLSCFHGRPGAIFPMDILGKSNRFSYAAAWGAISYLAADMVFSQTFAVRLEGKAYITAANGIISMLIYGVDYFPLFAGLSIDSVTGNFVATAYAWMLFSIEVYKTTECDLVYQARLIYIFRDLPILLCLGYLSLSLPIRTIQAFRDKTAKLLSSSEMVSVLNMTKDIESSPEAEHVKQLLIPPPAPMLPPDGILKKIRSVIKEIVGSWIYHNKHNFRYSSRILSVMIIGVILIYKEKYCKRKFEGNALICILVLDFLNLFFYVIKQLSGSAGYIVVQQTTLEMMVIVYALLEFIVTGFVEAMDIIGWQYIDGEDEALTALRQYTLFLLYIVIAGRVCFIVSLSLACVSGLLSILHMLSSYRTNLFDLYKGDTTHIPHRSTRSNASLMVGSMRYAGYQVGYIAWGLFIHFLILLIVTGACATVITMILQGWYQWIIDIFLNVWPVLLVTIFVTLGQLLVAKFIFLQERGEVLAIDNRRVLFSFTFFMFFYNIFIGFISCLLRIIKSIVIGAIFLPRLDNSALPRRFQMFDPGFAAYVGFVHVECAHTHPVLVLFLRIIMLDYEERQSGMDPTQTTIVNMKNTPNEKTIKRPRISTRARTRWCLAYTLYNNPSVRTSRKSYIIYLKETQERFAKTYNLNKTAMGKLVKEMNKSMTHVGTTGLDVTYGEQNGGLNQGQLNWNALLGMQKFMQALQKNPVNTNGSAGLSGIDLEVLVSGQHNPGFADDEKTCEGNNQCNGNVTVQDQQTGSLWKRVANSATTNTHSNVRL